MFFYLGLVKLNQSGWIPSLMGVNNKYGEYSRKILSVLVSWNLDYGKDFSVFISTFSQLWQNNCKLWFDEQYWYFQAGTSNMCVLAFSISLKTKKLKIWNFQSSLYYLVSTEYCWCLLWRPKLSNVFHRTALDSKAEKRLILFFNFPITSRLISACKYNWKF